jgi:aldehyde:ferredoxin oxidoreductase
MEEIIRVNLCDASVKAEPAPDEYVLLGGRSLTSRIIYDEVPPTCAPLGGKNKLIIAPGLLGGTPISSSSRLSIGGKSPLTGGIKEANSGGTAAYHMSRMNIKAIIIEGKSDEQKLQYLYIGKNEMMLRPWDEKDMGIFSSGELLKSRYGSKVTTIVIGPGGERGYFSAGIAVSDIDGRPSRFCARGGLGAVMGKKGLKAIVIDPQGGSPGVKYFDENAYKLKSKELNKIIRENPSTGDGLAKFGTAAVVARTNMLKGLPTRSFSQGTFENANKIDGESMYSLIKARGGEGSTTHSCMPGCMIRCSNIFPDQSGKELVSPLEYETIAMLGPNCGIGDLDEIARLNQKCNDLGIDTIEIGAALGVIMEKGVIPFGDAKAAEMILDEVWKDSLIGKIVAQGAYIAGTVLGAERIPVVKGQAMAAYDPRAIKGFGVTYATSPMGADHTAGPTLRANVTHTSPENQADASFKSQLVSGIADYTGLCMFTLIALGEHLDQIAGLIKYRSGKELNAEDLLHMSENMLLIETKFNQMAGMNNAHNRLPEFMKEEPLPEVNEVFDVPDIELDELFNLK